MTNASDSVAKPAADGSDSIRTSQSVAAVEKPGGRGGSRPLEHRGHSLGDSCSRFFFPKLVVSWMSSSLMTASIR